MNKRLSARSPYKVIGPYCKQCWENIPLEKTFVDTKGQRRCSVHKNLVRLEPRGSLHYRARNIRNHRQQFLNYRGIFEGEF